MSFDNVRDLYQDVILRHSKAPRNMHRLEPFDAAAFGDNPMCGDRCEVRVRYGADGSLDQVAFEGRGCAISMASADLMAEAAIGQPVRDVRAMAEDFFQMVRSGDADAATGAMAALKPLSGVSEYPSRIKCATLPWAALLAALSGEMEASSE
jgi:nitrogen fixation protein NifU and related proteins